MPAPGFLEGKYDVVAKLREGGMGAVYKVRHRLLNELRVVKVMHPQVASSSEQRKRFVREAQTATRLRHPHIVTFYDFAVDPDGTAYMVMEYVDGTDLADLVRRLGPLPVPIVLVLLKQCLSALAYLHKRGIVHRDVSPDNVLLSRDEDGQPQAKLIDLGIAKVARDQENLTAADEFLGKLRYASPEQLTNPTDGPIDGRSDLYSLGAATYELLTGICAFRGQSLQSILAAHLTGSPVPFSESDPKERVPLGLRRALIRALEIKPEERFPSAEEFLAEIEMLPQRALPEETHEFLLRALGRPQEPLPAEAVVDLPAPGTTQTETRTRAGGEESAPESTARRPSGDWPATRVLRTGAAAEAGPPPSERTELYHPQAPSPAPAAPSRSSRLIYAAIAAAAVLGLALLWLRGGGSREEPLAKKEAALPAATAAAPAPAPSSSVPGVVGAAPPESTAAAPVPTTAPSPAVEQPTAPPEVTRSRPRDATSSGAARDAARSGRGSGRSDASRTPDTRIASGSALPTRAAVSEPRSFYCANFEKTSYAQGAIKEPPRGFASDAAPALRGPRTDAARIHIDVAVRPEKPAEGEPFRVSARIVNDGDMDLVLDRAEESAERQEGGFRPVEGKGPVTVAVGGFAEIYRFEGALAAGATYRKDLRVIDRFGDSWRTSIRIVPCQ